MAIAFLAGLAIWRLHVQPPTVNSSVHPSPTAQVAVGSVYPASYVVVYDVHRNGAESWEVLRVDRPFAGSHLTYSSTGVPQPGDTPIAGSISTATALYAVNAPGLELVSARQPGPPSGDEFVGQELPDLVARGLTRSRGVVRTLAGRHCAVYRFAGPLAGPIARLPAGGDHDDLCLDADGLVLAETWTYHGKVVLQSTAVRVETSDRPIADSTLPAVPSTTNVQAVSPAAGTLAPDRHPSSLIAAPPAPAGFTAVGPAQDFRLPDPQSPGRLLAATVVWTFTSGDQVITVEAGRERGGAPPWQDGDTVTTPITLTGLGPATSALRSDGYQLRISLAGGGWVRVTGTVPLAELVAYGQLLRLS